MKSFFKNNSDLYDKKLINQCFSWHLPKHKQNPEKLYKDCTAFAVRSSW